MSILGLALIVGIIGYYLHCVERHIHNNTSTYYEKRIDPIYQTISFIKVTQ